MKINEQANAATVHPLGYALLLFCALFGPVPGLAVRWLSCVVSCLAASRVPPEKGFPVKTFVEDD